MQMTGTTDVSKELAKLPLARVQDILVARLVVREEAARMGFAGKPLTQIATSVSEMARNVIQHARAVGQIRIFHLTREDRVGIMIQVEDDGIGIPNAQELMAGALPGAGIPGCRKLMDEFSLQSSQGAGTQVSMVKWTVNDNRNPRQA
jgi:serine/threonine-protein kinase RsbT